MKKTFILIVFVLCTVTFCKGQKLFGIKAGAAFSKIEFEKFSTSSRTGYFVGLYAKLPVSGKVILQPELLYSSEGGGDNSYKYVTIPVMIKFYFYENLNLQFGPQAKYLLKVNNASLSSFKKVSYAVEGGVGFDVTEFLSFDLRYVHGISNMAKENINFSKQKTFRLGIGLKL